MSFPIPFRWRQAFAVGIVSLPAVASAQEPNPYAPPAPRGMRTVEVIYGTTKVWPVTRPAPMSLFPVPTTTFPARATLPAPRVTELLATPRIPAVAESETKLDRAPKVEESRPILLTAFTMPYPYPALPPQTSAAPWLLPAPPIAAPAPAAAPAATPPASPQPTVVVIRESANESHPAIAPVAEAAHGVTIGNETLLGFGVGAVGLGLGLAGRRRRDAATSSTSTTTPVHAMPDAPPPSNGMLLLGKYHAGPVPSTAERFELGPSYQNEQQEKKRVEESKQQAVLEFILSQNIALHSELAGPTTKDEGLPDINRNPEEPNAN